MGGWEREQTHGSKWRRDRIGDIGEEPGKGDNICNGNTKIPIKKKRKHDYT